MHCVKSAKRGKNKLLHTEGESPQILWTSSWFGDLTSESQTEITLIWMYPLCGPYFKIITWLDKQMVRKSRQNFFFPQRRQCVFAVPARRLGRTPARLHRPRWGAWSRSRGKPEQRPPQPGCVLRIASRDHMQPFNFRNLFNHTFISSKKKRKIYHFKCLKM